MLKLATWNVELPVSARRRAALRAHTDRVQADLWVLTETHDSFTPGHAFSHSSAPRRDGHHEPEHRPTSPPRKSGYPITSVSRWY